MPQPPSWPVFRAASRSTTSGSAHLAHHQPVRAASAAPAAPAPAAAPRPRPRCWPAAPPAATTCGWSGRSSLASSTSTIRSPRVDEREQRGQQRRLAGAGAAADQEGHPRARPAARSSGAPSALTVPALDQLLEGEHPGRAAPAATARVPGRDSGGEHGVEAGAVGQPERRRTAWRRRAGAPPSAASRWASRRTAPSSANRTAVSSRPVAAVDVDLVGAVDQHVGDAGRAAAAARAARHRARPAGAGRGPPARSRRRPDDPGHAAPAPPPRG